MSLEDRLRELLASILPRREVAHTLDAMAGLREAGLDSFRLMQLISDLEDTFHITLGDDDLVDHNFSTLAALRDFISNRLAG